MKPKEVHCAVEDLLGLIGGRWKVLLIQQLAAGPCRHGQLLRALRGITQKVLTHRLRDLEACGIVHRQSFLEGKIRVVEYSLTQWGQELKDFIDLMHAWAVKHRGRMTRSQSGRAGGGGTASR